MTTLLRKYSHKFSLLKDSILSIYDLSGESRIHNARKIVKNCDNDMIAEDWNKVGYYIRASIEEYAKKWKI